MIDRVTTRLLSGRVVHCGAIPMAIEKPVKRALYTPTLPRKIKAPENNDDAFEETPDVVRVVDEVIQLTTAAADAADVKLFKLFDTTKHAAVIPWPIQAGGKNLTPSSSIGTTTLMLSLLPM